jgi:hypothetical protein
MHMQRQQHFVTDKSAQQQCDAKQPLQRRMVPVNTSTAVDILSIGECKHHAHAWETPPTHEPNNQTTHDQPRNHHKKLDSPARPN